jgi:membrane fusion protein (multidrug efflux system)
MSGRRGWLGLVALAVLVFAVLILWRLAGTRPAEEEEITPEVPVQVGTLTRTTLQRVVETFGTVEPAPAEAGHPAAVARVAAPVTGTVASVRCVEGQRVERGAELVRLDTRVADAQVARATKAVEFAELTLARQREMVASEATSKRALQEAEQQLAAARGELAAAQADRALLVLTAPLAGTVLKVNVAPGQAVDPSVALVELADLGRLVVSAGVRSGDAPSVKVGQAVELSSAGAGSTPLAGTVVFVGPQVDPRTDTVPVRVSVPPGSRLAPGAFCDLGIVVETRRDCLAVPDDALVRDEAGHPAIAVVEGDTARLTPVQAGVRDRGLVEVTGEGLTEKTRIVVEGAYGLPKETKIKVTGP